MAKARAPKVLRRTRGTISWRRLADRLTRGVHLYGSEAEVLMYALIHKYIHNTHGSGDATLQSTIDIQEHSTAKTFPYIPISSSTHILHGRRHGLRRPLTVGWSSAMWPLSRYPTTLSLLPPDSPPAGPLHQQTPRNQVQ